MSTSAAGASGEEYVIPKGVHVKVFAIVAALVLTSAAGCSGEEPAIKAGTCIGKEIKDTGDAVPDLSSVVPCSEPHAYEITALIDLPAAALTGSSDSEKRANRADLAAPVAPKKPSPQRVAYDEFVLTACAKAMQRRTGLDAIAVGGKSALEAGVTVPLRHITLDWHSVTPEKEWLDGKRQVVCSSRLTADQDGKGNGNTKAMASPHGKPIVPTLLTPTFPPNWRHCHTFDADENPVPVDCSKQHFSELAFSFHAEAVLGNKYVQAFDLDAAGDADYAKLDALCAGALKYYLAPNWDRNVLKAYADPVVEGWGSDAGESFVMCKVSPREAQEFDLPGGSLVDATGKGLKLVPVA
jgi:hypothetical protein